MNHGDDFVIEEEEFDFPSKESLKDWRPDFNPSFFGIEEDREEIPTMPFEHDDLPSINPPGVVQPKSKLFNNEIMGQSTADSLNSISDSSKGGCRCKKSQCMRLHCQCLLNQNFCSPSCRCVDCINTEENAEVRQFVMEKTKIIFPQAFESKLKTTEDEQKINVVGCKCRMGCQKRYCECFKMGVGCSPICKCESCKNNFVDLPKEEISEIFLPHRRKKHKLMMQNAVGDDSNEIKVVFQPYVRPK